MDNILEILVAVLNLLAYYLIGIKKRYAFIIGFIGCIAGIGLFYDMASLLIMYIIFAILNVKNYLQWNIK